jgi:23S rRNA (pseudouridine1915-N3)-methyltransferase
MKLQCWTVGKGHESYVNEGITMFSKRISHYYPIEWQIIAPAKNAQNASEEEIKEQEGQSILKNLKQDDYLILLDERGKMLSSPELANFIISRANESKKQLIFLIGGAFGVSKDVSKRANYTWSISPLVFPHQIVRLILAEQIYRACTIIKNEKYHHS